MKNNSAGAWGQPGVMGDSLTELLRRGARDLIEQAVEVELQAVLAEYANVTDRRDARPWSGTATCRNGRS